MVPEKGVTITGEGKGGPAGFAKGGAKVALAPEGDGTRLSYTVEASVGGKLAQLGSRIVDGFAKRMADQFFENFKSALEPPEPEKVAEGDGDGDDGAAKKGWFRRTFGG
jgi:carbon monoxide dehydrogenase subunit G